MEFRVLAGAAVVFLFCSCSWVAALPIPPPDLDNCQPILVGDSFVDCCLPTDVPVKEFKYPDDSEPIKVRKNAVSLDAESIEKYNLAYLKMRALPANDPRSHTVQYNIHCGYCTEVFRQQNSTKKLEIHRNWLLLPFHRMYVYFHERILASLIDDPTFAIPFFNWDNQSSIHHPSPNAIPEYFYSKPGLFDANRDPHHAPPSIPDLHWGPFFGFLTPNGSTDDELRVLNNKFMYEAAVSGSALPELFLGGLYRFDEDLPYSPSLFEIGPHASIHGWVGSDTLPKGEDMSPSYSSARDPVFFSHHSNVDRIFRDWHALGGRRGYPKDPDWLNSSFLFYDEMGELVRVTVAQTLDMDRLRYTYEPSENSWLHDPSISLSARASSQSGSRNSWLTYSLTSILSWLGIKELLHDIPDIRSVKEVTFSSSAFHSRVALPQASLQATGELNHLEKVLVIDKIWVPSKQPIWFDIFINLPEANENTPLNIVEWCGTFSNGPHIDHAGRTDRHTVFSLSISEKLRKLGIDDRESLVVSLVPKGTFKHQRKVQVHTIRVELR